MKRFKADSPYIVLFLLLAAQLIGGFVAPIHP
jgi:hypothetical protein